MWMFTTSRGGEEANGARVCECVRKWIIDACVRMMLFLCVVSFPCICKFENLKLLESVKSKNFLELLLVQLCQNIMRLHNPRILAEQPIHKRRRRCRFPMARFTEHPSPSFFNPNRLRVVRCKARVYERYFFDPARIFSVCHFHTKKVR